VVLLALVDVPLGGAWRESFGVLVSIVSTILLILLAPIGLLVQLLVSDRRGSALSDGGDMSSSTNGRTLGNRRHCYVQLVLNAELAIEGTLQGIVLSLRVQSKILKAVVELADKDVVLRLKLACLLLF